MAVRDIIPTDPVFHFPKGGVSSLSLHPLPVIKCLRAIRVANGGRFSGLSEIPHKYFSLIPPWARVQLTADVDHEDGSRNERKKEGINKQTNTAKWKTTSVVLL